MNKADELGTVREDKILEAFDLRGKAKETTVIPTFRCPVDNGSDIVEQYDEFRQGIKQYARSNYNGCGGDGVGQGYYRLGINRLNRPATHEMVRDGASSTFALGEQDSDDEDPKAPWWHCQIVGTCEKPINSRDDAGRKLTTCFRSRHPDGGAHFLMVDGAVRFVSEKIDLATYRALSTMDSGDLVSEF